MYKSSEKTEFSERLKEQLNSRGWPINSPTWLSREFNIRYSGTSVSVQTASNWLSGAAIPSQDKLQILAAWLEVSSHWLRFGEDSIHMNSLPLENNQTIYQNIQYNLTDLPEKIAQLTPQQKQVVYNVVEAILGNK